MLAMHAFLAPFPELKSEIFRVEILVEFKPTAFEEGKVEYQSGKNLKFLPIDLLFIADFSISGTTE